MNVNLHNGLRDPFKSTNFYLWYLKRTKDTQGSKRFNRLVLSTLVGSEDTVGSKTDTHCPSFRITEESGSQRTGVPIPRW